MPFDASVASSAAHEVQFEKRPFGTLRYQPGNGGKGAMAMEVIPKSRYPGDPKGPGLRSGREGRLGGEVHQRRGHAW